MIRQADNVNHMFAVTLSMHTAHPVLWSTTSNDDAEYQDDRPAKHDLRDR